MSSPFDIALKLPGEDFRFFDRPLADGLRASTASECASCAIIEYLNPSDERLGDHVNQGVATLGHALHQMWAWQVFAETSDMEVEAAIPWKHGVSHDDVIVHDGEWAGVYEVKTHSETKPTAPSEANYRQSRFRMRLRERANLPMPGPMRLVMIGKAGREGGWVRGPWTVTLDKDQRAEIDKTLDTIDLLIAKADTLDLHGPELKELANECSRCFPKPKIAAPGTASGWLNKYAAAKREHDEFDTKRKEYADAKAALKTEMDKARAELDKLVPAGVVMEAMSGATATRNRAGNLTIKTPPVMGVEAA